VPDDEPEIELYAPLVNPLGLPADGVALPVFIGLAAPQNAIELRHAPLTADRRSFGA
jgi:hypothetical protein